MSYTVTKLVTNSWYLSGIVSRNLQKVTGDQLNDGVDLLNSVIAEKSIDGVLIPYFDEYDLTAVVGDGEYLIPGLIMAQTFTFNIGTLRYSTKVTGRKKFFGDSRVDDIQSLPYDYHFERTLGGSNLFLYFVPNTTYPMKIWGKFALSSVTINQDLSLTLDQFYIDYLRYATANFMCQEYNITMQPQAYQQFLKYEQMLRGLSPIDLQMTKMSGFTKNYPDLYGQVNLGKGWTV